LSGGFFNPTTRTAWLRAALQPATLFGGLLIITCWIGLVFMLSLERSKTLESASQQTANLARLFDDYTVRILQGIDQTLLLLREAYEADPAHFDLPRLAQQTHVIRDLTIQLAVIGVDGFMIAASSDNDTTTNTPVYVGDREHFRAQISPKSDDLFIGEPVTGRFSGKWTIQLSRRLQRPNGSFGGIIVASLDPSFVGAFARTLDIGRHGTVTVRRQDGMILAAYGYSGPSVGQFVLQPALREALARAPAGHYWGGGAVDGINRLVGYHVLKDLPLVAFVGLADSDLFIDYERHRMIYIAVALVLTLLVLVAIGGSIRRQMRLDRVRDELKRSEAHARAKSRELELTLDHMNQGIIMTDANRKIPVINRKAIDLLGLPDTFRTGSLRAGDIRSYLVSTGESGSDDDLLDPAIYEFPKPDVQSVNVALYERTRPNGVVLEFQNTVLPDGAIVRTITNVTERKRAEQEILRLAHRDPVTDVANRNLLRARIEQSIERMVRTGQAFAVLCVDLDHFKAVNDMMGHMIGDELLRKVAERLGQRVGASDTVARLGGDEFVVLQAEITEVAEVRRLAQDILQAVTAPYEINGSPVLIGTSIGIAMAPRDGASMDELLSHADLALYRAKAEGRNTFWFYDAAMGQAALERGRLEHELRDAIAKEQFELYYQPWISIATGRIAGCEALLRWRHPMRGLLGPQEFVGVAEETGLIVQLGDWVLRQACSEAANWPAQVKIAVNLSAAQFIGGNLAETVHQAVSSSRLAARRLELEITETMFLGDQERTLRALQALHDQNINIALDDFGSGYSSLTYLRQYPIDRIKIDRAFVAEMTTNPNCAAIIAAVVSLGRSLGVDVTAEGIETHDQFVMLRAAGCTEGQGYLFGRPQSAADIRKTLSAVGAGTASSGWNVAIGAR
jgi:diguanylate cyclase (GGDEF)-like protein